MRSKTPHICVPVPTRTKFQSVSLYVNPFLSCRSFWDKNIERPENNLDHYRINDISYWYPPVLNFNSVYPTASFFLNELQAILRQVLQSTLKLPWTLQGQIHLTYRLLLHSESQISIYSLYSQPFSSYRLSWEKSTEWPQNDLLDYVVKSNTCVVYFHFRVTNFTPFRSMANRLRVTGHCEISAPNDPQMTLNCHSKHLQKGWSKNNVGRVKFWHFHSHIVHVNENLNSFENNLNFGMSNSKM